VALEEQPVISRNYAILNAAQMGANLELSLSGLQVDFNTNSTNINRSVRGTIGASSGFYFFECAFFSKTGNQIIDNSVSVGVAKSTAGLNKFVGGDINGYGYRDGALWWNDSPLSTPITAASLKDVVGIALKLDGSGAVLRIYLNGNLLWTNALPAAQTWYPAVTVSGSTAFDMSAFCNFGQRAFEYPIAGYENGWSTARSGIGTILLASEDYLTAPADTPANTLYKGRLLNAESLQISRQSKVWPWAQRNDSVSFSTVDIDNYDGAYDNLLATDIRDSIVTLKMVGVGAAYSTATTVATGIVDKVQTIGEDLLRITLRDKLTLLDRPLQNKLLPPYVSESAANKPCPIALGACRTITPVLIDEQTITYKIHDSALTEIAVVSDNADPLDPAATPQDWIATGDNSGLQLNVFPVNGKLTADVSSSGINVIPPGPSDELSGDGQFTTWSAPDAVNLDGLPNGWLKDDVHPAVRPGTGTISNISPNTCTIRTNVYEQSGNNEFGFWLKYSSNILKAGKTYRWSFELKSVKGIDDNVFGGRHGLNVVAELAGTPEFWFSPFRAPLTVPGVYSGTYTNITGTDQTVYILSQAGGPAAGNCIIQIANFVIQEVVAYVPPPLVGITLQEYGLEVLQNRGKLLSAEWSSSDAAALDTATNNVFGFYSVDQINISSAMRLPLDSYCAALYADKLGVIRMSRLYDPDTASDGSIKLEISASNIRASQNGSAMLSIEVDPAPGLTTYMGARRNWTTFTDSEFVSDYAEVTAALRSQLKRKSQFVVASNVSVASQYRHAINAGPMDSLLDDTAKAQVEIDRVCDLYTKLRYFRTFTVLYAGDAPDLNFGDIVRATYARWGLDSGKKLFVVGIAHRPFIKEIEITTWG